MPLCTRHKVARSPTIWHKMKPRFIDEGFFQYFDCAPVPICLFCSILVFLCRYCYRFLVPCSQSTFSCRHSNVERERWFSSITSPRGKQQDFVVFGQPNLARAVESLLPPSFQPITALLLLHQIIFLRAGYSKPRKNPLFFSLAIVENTMAKHSLCARQMQLMRGFWYIPPKQQNFSRS